MYLLLSPLPSRRPPSPLISSLTNTAFPSPSRSPSLSPVLSHPRQTSSHTASRFPHYPQTSHTHPPSLPVHELLPSHPSISPHSPQASSLTPSSPLLPLILLRPLSLCTNPCPSPPLPLPLSLTSFITRDPEEPSLARGGYSEMETTDRISGWKSVKDCLTMDRLMKKRGFEEQVFVITKRGFYPRQHKRNVDKY